ncbi:MAG: hypothetical protein RLZ12_386 [Bacillota bacterium]|jgi:hypothetical protein
MRFLKMKINFCKRVETETTNIGITSFLSKVTKKSSSDETMQSINNRVSGLEELELESPLTDEVESVAYRSEEVVIEEVEETEPVDCGFESPFYIEHQPEESSPCLAHEDIMPSDEDWAEVEQCADDLSVDSAELSSLHQELLDEVKLLGEQSYTVGEARTNREESSSCEGP